MPFHPVDVKAKLKKRYGSVLAFERHRGLPSDSVRDVLRGRANRRVARVIADELDVNVHQLLPDRHESRKRDDNAEKRPVHPQSRCFD
ncbi:helix-turn-helix domain-containing protein [Parasphingopyxis sp.]|uniref:helix-turn-helix domain-containing protein n=1 Tax=Parasphingopyxis sp. TaxID=1920299 RepID=UPI0032EAC8B5